MFEHLQSFISFSNLIYEREKMEKYLFRKFGTSAIFLALVILVFFLLKPFLIAILLGLILALVLYPIFSWIVKKISHKGWASFIVCILLAGIIFIPLWFLLPVLVKQSIQIFMASQQLDLVTPFKNLFPSLFAYEQIGSEMSSIIYSFVTNLTNSAMNILSDVILNFAKITLQILVVLFVFFFALKDGKKLVRYLQSILPFEKEVEKKLFKSSKEITYSVLYGQVLLGVLQGIIVGIGFFAFGVSNALFLTIIATFAGIFPIIGTMIVWLPVVIYMMITGDSVGAIIGVFIFGVLSSLLENIIKPVFVSHRTNLHSALVLIGMIGGVFMFGILGIILGPLILAYLLIILEVYRNKKVPGLITESSNSK
jgi:predicted PurR-regulated permease PerM